MPPRAVLNPSPAAPPRVGLIASARTPAGEDDRWTAGFEWQPEGCGGSGTFDPCATDTDKPTPDGPVIINYSPFGIWAGDKCSSFGWSARDFQGRAQRLLASCESYQVEREFWRGDQARASDWENSYLTHLDSDVVTDGPTGLTDALACLEQGLAQCNCGQRGMIHATRQTVIHWNLGGALRREGALLLTVNDNIVVPGAGYDGSGPQQSEGGEPVAAAEGSVWAYATGIVDVRLDRVEIIPGSFPEALDRAANTIEFRAERLAAATHNGCCIIAAEIDMSLCGIGGAGS